MTQTLLCIRSTLVSVEPLACQMSMPVAGLTNDLYAAVKRVIPKGTINMLDSLIAQNQLISIVVSGASDQPNLCESGYSTFCKLFAHTWRDFADRYCAAWREQRLAPVRSADRNLMRINSVLDELRNQHCSVTLAPGTADELELISIDPDIVRMELPVAQQTAMVVDAVIRGCREIPGSARLVNGGVHVEVVVTLEHDITELMLCCARTEAQTYYAGDNTLTANVAWTGDDLPRVVGDYVIVRR
jgi:hypothetical protein